MKLHYEILTGRIVSWGSEDGIAESHFEGCAVLVLPDVDESGKVVEAHQGIGGLTHRIDVATRLPVPLTEAATARAPSLSDLDRAVSQELAVSDRYLLPDFPVSAGERAAWIAYRKALRDCSKGTTCAQQMLSVVPARPDGIDAFGALRAGRL